MVIRDRCLFRVSFNGILLLLVVGLFGLVFGLASSSFVSALTYSSSAELEFTFLPSITITFSPNTGFIINDLSAGNSAYSNTVTLSVDSNSSDGYILSATVGKTNDNNRNNNRLVHSNNTDYFEGIATNASLTLNNLGSNKWGYSTYDTTNEEWSDYSGLATIGNTGTTLITTDTSGTTELDMKIGASAAVNQVAGAFTNDINFTATANVVTYDYTITFVANNSGTVTNMPTDITSASYNTGGIVQISPTIPTLNDYVFLGWCDGTVTGTTCTGNLYQPGDYLKLDSASSSVINNITLNAVWQFNGIYMQDITDAQCQVNVGTNGNTTGIGDNITVYDKRSSNYPSGDEGDYTVRWINGNCWMTQNLRVQGTLSATDSNFTGADFNVSAYDLKTNGASGGECNSASGFNNTCSHTPDNTDLSTIGNGATIKSVGRWYNFYAASAGTISTNSNSTAATSDICPAGWHLPSGPNTTANTDYNKLVGNTTSGYQIPTAGLTAFSAVAGGDYRNGSLNYTGFGFWWSSTSTYSTTRRSLVYDSSNGQFSGDYYDMRYFGIFVRCVKRSYMQEQTTSSLAVLMPNIGDTVMLYDKRDGQTYYVGKLADNNYWMLDNLALDITAVDLATLKGNTNADDTSLTALKNGGGDTHYAKAPVTKNWTSSERYFDEPMIAVDSATSDGCYNANWCVNSDSSWSFASITSSTINGNTSIAQGKIGVYYNYCAASAGYYCYTDSAGVDNPDGITTLQDSKYDICPKGWRLPTSSLDGEFQALYESYNSDYTSFQVALSMPLSGNFDEGDTGKANYQGRYGYLLSSTWSNNNNMYSLRVESSDVIPSDYTRRVRGRSVRCIFDK